MELAQPHDGWSNRVDDPFRYFLEATKLKRESLQAKFRITLEALHLRDFFGEVTRECLNEEQASDRAVCITSIITLIYSNANNYLDFRAFCEFFQPHVAQTIAFERGESVNNVKEDIHNELGDHSKRFSYSLDRNDSQARIYFAELYAEYTMLYFASAMAGVPSPKLPRERLDELTKEQVSFFESICSSDVGAFDKAHNYLHAALSPAWRFSELLSNGVTESPAFRWHIFAFIYTIFYTDHKPLNPERVKLFCERLESSLENNTDRTYAQKATLVVTFLAQTFYGFSDDLEGTADALFDNDKLKEVVARLVIATVKNAEMHGKLFYLDRTLHRSIPTLERIMEPKDEHGPYKDQYKKFRDVTRALGCTENMDFSNLGSESRQAISMQASACTFSMMMSGGTVARNDIIDVFYNALGRENINITERALQYNPQLAKSMKFADTFSPRLITLLEENGQGLGLATYDSLIGPLEDSLGGTKVLHETSPMEILCVKHETGESCDPQEWPKVRLRPRSRLISWFVLDAKKNTQSDLRTLYLHIENNYTDEPKAKSKLLEMLEAYHPKANISLLSKIINSFVAPLEYILQYMRSPTFYK